MHESVEDLTLPRLWAALVSGHTKIDLAIDQREINTAIPKDVEGQRVEWVGAQRALLWSV